MNKETSGKRGIAEKLDEITKLPTEEQQAAINKMPVHFTLNDLSFQAHTASVSKGFYEGPQNIGEKLALIHSEVSEALEADRAGKYADQGSKIPKGYVAKLLNAIPADKNETFKELFLEKVKDTFEDELSDTLIRILDLAGYLQINLDEHVKAKMRYNSLRPHKHGKTY